MMATIDLLKETGSSMLGNRPAARAVEPAMRASMENGAITLDTAGVQRIGVSFFDETLLILRELMNDVGDDLRLVYHKAPPLVSLKDLASNRGLKVSESPSGDWIISASHRTNA